ncbi:MAG: 6-phospho-beta-glucosidase, partial [Actinobacteria bacterium]|nr:6-phospho-beta-glucosidase [Actinomycetota bacterium]
MKLSVIGGGGVRTPGMVEALLDARDLRVEELVLHDVDPERLALVAAVIHAICSERGSTVPFRVTTDVDDALEGADFVFCAIRVGGLEGRLVDETVPLELGLLGQETVGAGGLCYALRTLPPMIALAERVAQRAPRAWFLNYTNPAGLVTEALAEVLGDRVVGICDAPAALFAGVARALECDPDQLEFDYGGINHLGWLKAVRDRGRDLLPDLLGDDARLATLHEGRVFPRDLLRTLGRIPNEYLAYYYCEREIVAAIRAAEPRAKVLLDQQARFYGETAGDPAGALAAWREVLRQRSASYMAEVENAAGAETGAVGDVPPDGGLGGYTGVALGVVRALVGGRAETLVLNTPNGGAVPFLDENAVVEVPCVVDGAGVRALPSSGWTLHEQGLVSLVKDA